MITQTSLNNPKFAKKIRRNFWICKMEAIKTKQRAICYIKNRKGNNSLRIDVHPKGDFVAYSAGNGSKNCANLINHIVRGI